MDLVKLQNTCKKKLNKNCWGVQGCHISCCNHIPQIHKKIPQSCTVMRQPKSPNPQLQPINLQFINCSRAILQSPCIPARIMSGKTNFSGGQICLWERGGGQSCDKSTVKLLTTAAFCDMLTVDCLFIDCLHLYLPLEHSRTFFLRLTTAQAPVVFVGKLSFLQGF